ncbi:hypothetical protein NE235_32395 [Actinoallomurus spadix]|uniref:Uncharacterized protein n=1 Tax=Actinoallomurus spadix TaxID=79912 RepID=A0ABP3GRK7_9ACTN|nr:hypothetical protein [Actinoallomurus spadix]MCO5990822.1 hypothetical protein [Actinoallomurus spadix]
MSRHMHFVGSLPPDVCGTPRQAMEWITGRVGGHRLTALPCDLDPDWIVAYLRNIAARPAFEMKRPGEYTGYEDMRRYGVRRGHELQPADVSMDREDALREMLEAFRALRAERPELADVRLQLSLPNPLDLAIFVFEGRPWLALRYLPVFTRALVEEVTAFAPVGGRDVVWQLETPSVLVGMDMAKRLPGGRSLAARLLARQVAGLLTRLPAETDVILHLCYGNLGNTELVAPRDLGPAVTYLNHLAPALRRHGLRPGTPHHRAGREGGRGDGRSGRRGLALT